LLYRLDCGKGQYHPQKITKTQLNHYAKIASVVWRIDSIDLVKL